MASCFRCDGTGLICDVCGESEVACHCEGEPRPTFSECPDCDGYGGTESMPGDVIDPPGGGASEP